MDDREQHEFNVRLSEYGVAMAHRQGEKARVLAEVLQSMYAALSAPPATPAGEPDAIPSAQPAPETPLQGGMDNAVLRAAWDKKVPGVAPDDRQLTAFALGVEAGFAHARDLEKQDWSRFHHVMKKHGLHPGRTGDDLIEVLDAAYQKLQSAYTGACDRIAALLAEREASTATQAQAEPALWVNAGTLALVKMAGRASISASSEKDPEEGNGTPLYAGPATPSAPVGDGAPTQPADHFAGVNKMVATQPAGEEARPLEEWHEDDGQVVWWKFPIEEAGWIGSPHCSDWPGYHTHWTPHPPIPTAARAA